MIANPTIAAFRYDPYEKKITHEGYDHEKMRAVRASAIRIAEESLTEKAGTGPSTEALDDAGEKSCGRAWAVVLGTLGRQGSLSVLKVEPSSRISIFTTSPPNEKRVFP